MERERSFISLNLPNIITINLIGWLGFGLVILVYQMIMKARGGSTVAVGSGAATTSQTSATPTPALGLTLTPGMRVAA